MTETPAHTLRRQHVLRPGDHLLMPNMTPDQNVPGMLVLMERADDFMTYTGLDAEQVLTVPMVACALPIYQGLEPSPRLWSHVPPHALWHPLFWLPESVHETKVLSVEGDEDTDGEIRPEGRYEWAIRVAFELTLSRMYDPDTGGWVDILALYGLDVTDPAVLERITAWQQGGPDALLDSIDLTENFQVEDGADQNWAFQRSVALAPHMLRATYALTGRDVRDLMAALHNQQIELDFEDLTGQVHLAAAILDGDAGDAVIDGDVTAGRDAGDVADALNQIIEENPGEVDRSSDAWGEVLLLGEELAEVGQTLWERYSEAVEAMLLVSQESSEDEQW